MARAQPSSRRLNLTLPADLRIRLLEEARIERERLPRLVVRLANEALGARTRRRLDATLAEAYRGLADEHEALAREFACADSDGLK